ncbi:MAG: inositol monophosphatase [Desulfuromonadales bacterium]|nr:inositol monophosphatase [Desulfuromonadales bacterium]
MKDLLINAVRQAGTLLMEKFERGILVEYKGKHDLVTEADRQSEALIVKLIRDQFPDHDILAEESDYGHSRSACRWIIDPLDGTTNYAHGFPWFAVSVALEINGRLELGAVYNPYVGDLYFAERGAGAFLNDRPLQVSTIGTLERSLLATGFAYNHKACKANNYDFFIRFQKASQACRRPGAASLDLACVAAGRFDGFWEMNLKPWDLAAGILLIEEAGGQVSDFDGRSMTLDSLECLASNGLVHAEMQVILQQGCRPHDDLPA